MSEKSRSAAGGCELRTEAVARTSAVRNPAESHGDLVSVLPRAAAEKIAARLLDDAMGDTGRSNTSVADACGLNEKSIRNARLGAQTLPLHTLLQVDPELRGAIINGIERECARLYGSAAPLDVRTALLNVGEHALTFGVAVTRGLKRLSTGRALAVDHREAITTEWAGLVRSGDEMVTALNASSLDR